MLRKLKLLIEQKGLSQVSLAEKSGVHKVTISNILNEKDKLSEEVLKRLLVGLDYRPSEADQLIAQWKLEDSIQNAEDVGVKVERLEETLEEMLSRRGVKGVESYDKANYAEIPRLGSAACGMIQGDKIRSGDILGFDYFPRQVINSKKNYFTVLADGLSMQGEIEHDDVVLVETCSENVKGKPMLVQYNEDCAFGYLIEERGLWRIEKANRSFPPIALNDEKFRIIGVARHINRKL